MVRIRPLSTGQQKFLQLLMARHVLSDSEAKSLFSALSADAAENGEMGRNLEHCLGIINSSLGPAFGLEIRTVSFDRRCAGGAAAAAAANGGGGNGSDVKESSESSEKGGGGSGGTSKMIRYHALINKVTDEASKSTFMTATALSNPLHGPSVRSPHEMAYLRVIIERIVERGMELDDDAAAGGSGSGVGAGCRGSLGRIAVLNLRDDLEGPHEKTISVGQAEHVVSSLVAEGWLVPTVPVDDDGDDDDEDENDDDDETGEDGGSKKRRRGGSSKRKGGRTSLDGLGGDGPALSHLMIGPRTYMELPDLLKDVGLAEDRVPQFILHAG
mmetsp:Transcript_3650/g.7076  ORF Transcript_3650/g.7076 Transcript_3650/m.7076 type:complete len:328 (+) Transcript_3650:245-1228(+)